MDVFYLLILAALYAATHGITSALRRLGGVE
jgi:hypothetical protein